MWWDADDRFFIIFATGEANSLLMKLCFLLNLYDMYASLGHYIHTDRDRNGQKQHNYMHTYYIECRINNKKKN